MIVKRKSVVYEVNPDHVCVVFERSMKGVYPHTKRKESNRLSVKIIDIN